MSNDFWAYWLLVVFAFVFGFAATYPGMPRVPRIVLCALAAAHVLPVLVRAWITVIAG